MNKELREEMEYLITCDDKSITPDVRDDVKMTLDYIDELEEEIKEYEKIFDTFSSRPYAHRYLEEKRKELNNPHIIGLDSEMIYKDYYELIEIIDNALKLLDSYKLGKYDYALTPAGLLDFEDILKGRYIKRLK